VDVDEGVAEQAVLILARSGDRAYSGGRASCKPRAVVFASFSHQRGEETGVGPGMAGVPSRLDRLWTSNMRSWPLILTGIRGERAEKTQVESIEAFDGASRYPTPGVFAAKSAEVIEKKVVEFWARGKECARV